MFPIKYFNHHKTLEMFLPLKASTFTYIHTLAATAPLRRKHSINFFQNQWMLISYCLHQLDSFHFQFFISGLVSLWGHNQKENMFPISFWSIIAEVFALNVLAVHCKHCLTAALSVSAGYLAVLFFIFPNYPLLHFLVSLHLSPHPFQGVK